MWLGYAIRLPVELAQNRFAFGMLLKASHEKCDNLKYRKGEAREVGHELTKVDPVVITRALHIGLRLSNFEQSNFSIGGY